MHLLRAAGYRSAWNFRISRPPADSFGADAPGERASRPATRGHPFHSGYRRVSTASSVLGYAGVVTLACDGYSNRSCRALPTRGLVFASSALSRRLACVRTIRKAAASLLIHRALSLCSSP